MKKDLNYLIFIFIISCRGKNYSAGFLNKFRYVCGRSRAFINNTKIISFIIERPVSNLANTVFGLPYILVSEGEGSNGVKGDIGNNGN